MPTIRISHEDAARLPAIERLAEEVVTQDPNWAGAEFTVEIGEFTEIDCEDEIAGAALYAQVRDCIDNPRQPEIEAARAFAHEAGAECKNQGGDIDHADRLFEMCLANGEGWSEHLAVLDESDMREAFDEGLA